MYVCVCVCVCVHGSVVFYFHVYVPIISCIAATFSGAQFLCFCTSLQTQKLCTDKLKFGICTRVYICSERRVIFFRSNIWCIHLWQRTFCHLPTISAVNVERSFPDSLMSLYTLYPCTITSVLDHSSQLLHIPLPFTSSNT